MECLVSRQQRDHTRVQRSCIGFRPKDRVKTMLSGRNPVRVVGARGQFRGIAGEL